MKILITGGAGYIGSEITTLALGGGMEVVVVDKLWFDEEIPLIHINNKNYSFYKDDISRDDYLDYCLDGVDYVLHLAAVVGDPASKKFPELTQKINLDASIKLIDTIKNTRIKGIVFFSTCSNYGISDGIAREESPLKPLSLYAETKVAVEQYLMNEVQGLDWVICRLSTVYGAGARMRFDLTVNDFTMNAFIKKYLDIYYPESFRPYVHVHDIAQIVVSMLRNYDTVKNNVFNVGFIGENYEKIRIAELAKKYMPGTKIEIVKGGGDLRDYKVDFSKLNNALNLQNSFTVEDGVKQVVKLLENRIFADPYSKKYHNLEPNLEDSE